MSGSAEDRPSARARGAVFPPASEEAAPLDVPRLEPPPPSLEAMVQSTTSARRGERDGGWVWLALLLALAAVATAILSR